MFDDISGMLGNFSGTIGELSGDVSSAASAIKGDISAYQGDVQNIEQNAASVYGSVASSVNSLVGDNILPSYNGSIPGMTPTLLSNGNTLEIPQVYTGTKNFPAPNPPPSPNPSGSFYPSGNPPNGTPANSYPFGTNIRVPGLDVNASPGNITPAFWDTINSSPFAGSSGTLVLGLLVLLLVIVAVKRA